MNLRIVRVTIAHGRTDDYWRWAGEIIALWDAQGVQRAGGPYAGKGPAGEDTALWFTVHESGADPRAEFERVYAGEAARALLARRPPLVASTVTEIYTEWPGAGRVAAPPPA